MKALLPLVSGLLLCGPGLAQDQAELLAALAGDQDLPRELARRRLTLATKIPETEVVRLLGSSNIAIVVAAATLLRDRGLARAPLQRHARHAAMAVRRVVLPVASDADVLRQFERDEELELRIAAMFELEDRGQLTAERLTKALLAEAEDLREAACRLIVYERSPFPVAIAERLLAQPAARRSLLFWLADRPRAHAGAWLQRVLGAEAMPKLERLLAIHALPPDWIDAELAEEILRAAVVDSAELSNRAASAAARLPTEVADQMIAVVLKMVAAGSDIEALLPCLARVSRRGETRLFDAAIAGDAALLHSVSHWLSVRQSKLVARYVAAALDAEAAFPVELIGLTGPALRVDGIAQEHRITKVVKILEAGGDPAVGAFSALIEAAVYRPPMAGFAEAGVVGDKARRLFRLFKLPPENLPRSLFARVLARDDYDALIYAVNALSRGPLDPGFEAPLLQLALESEFPLLRSTAGRTLVLCGSVAAGRRVFRAQRGERQVIGWLISSPKPWSHDLLLQERESMTAERRQHAAAYHQVLIALARLGDRGASEELVGELPRLRPLELQEAQKLMGRYYKAADLQRIATEHLVVRPLAKGEEIQIDSSPDDERRAELLTWFIERKGLDLEPLLIQLWQTDQNYEVRLVALRGLLARDSVVLHGKLQSLVERPGGEDQEELAFEVIGSMAHPMSDKALDLLARILLLAPLSEPEQEVRLAMEQGYDSARGAYPLNMPAANLLRRDQQVRPGPAFAGVAAQVGGRLYALNRQRLGLFLGAISLRQGLLADLGPVLARLILAAPDRSPDFVGVAQWILAERAELLADYHTAARLFGLANRAFCRGVVPNHIQRSFLGDVDPAEGRHPYAALAAGAAICQARMALLDERPRLADRHLSRARDLAEGDARTIETIEALRRAKRP